MAIEILNVTERDPGAKVYDFNIVATEEPESPDSILDQLAALVAKRRSATRLDPEVSPQSAESGTA
jgi:hypothetical protein